MRFRSRGQAWASWASHSLRSVTPDVNKGPERSIISLEAGAHWRPVNRGWEEAGAGHRVVRAIKYRPGVRVLCSVGVLERLGQVDESVWSPGGGGMTLG